MTNRINVTRLTRHQKFYLAGFRRGCTAAMAEARQLFREELHSTFKELVELQAAYAALAERHHKAMHDNAVSEAVHEREANPFRPLH